MPQNSDHRDERGLSMGTLGTGQGDRIRRDIWSLTHRQMFDMSGGSAGTSCTSLSAALRQAVKDPGVGSIVLDIDSPGGDVEGVDELASEIYAARKQKKTPLYPIAFVRPQLTSGGPGIRNCGQPFILDRLDRRVHVARGRLSSTWCGWYKARTYRVRREQAETNNLGPLSDTAPAHLQGIVNGFGVAFEKAVARGRGIKQDEVHNKFGGGRVFDAKTAVRIGMAHRVATLTDVLTVPPSLSTSASRRWAQFAAMPASAAAKKRKAEFARMRHQLLMAKNGTVAAPNGGIDPPAPTIIHRV
jgi:ClpP class serine protease